LTEERSRHISNMRTLLRHSVTRALGGSVMGGTVGVASKIDSKRAFCYEHWFRLWLNKNGTEIWHSIWYKKNM